MIQDETMHFGENLFYGTPLYLNGEIAGWVCTTLNDKWCYLLAHHKCDDSPRYDSQHQAKLALMAIFGE